MTTRKTSLTLLYCNIYTSQLHKSGKHRTHINCQWLLDLGNFRHLIYCQKIVLGTNPKVIVNGNPNEATRSWSTHILMGPNSPTMEFAYQALLQLTQITKRFERLGTFNMHATLIGNYYPSIAFSWEDRVYDKLQKLRVSSFQHGKAREIELRWRREAHRAPVSYVAPSARPSSISLPVAAAQLALSFGFKGVTPANIIAPNLWGAPLSAITSFESRYHIGINRMIDASAQLMNEFVTTRR